MSEVVVDREDVLVRQREDRRVVDAGAAAELLFPVDVQQAPGRHEVVRGRATSTRSKTRA